MNKILRQVLYMQGNIFQIQLEEHKKEHQNEWVKPTNPQCRQCKWQFSRASALREHMKEHYKVNEEESLL
jgi:hypothetical protein